MSRPAVLFWVYRDLLVCRNRLDLLRRDNPDTAIFGLYGGPAAEADRFRDVLAPQLDDFWAFPDSESSKWKWLNGDLMLAAWYEARGRDLAWEHVFVAQWDMLVLRPLDELLPDLGDRDVLLSGVQPVAAVQPHWVWAKGGHAPTYTAFVEWAQARFGAVEPQACLFVIACLPRALFEAYRELGVPATGYVEYRLPTIAKGVGLNLVDDPRFRSWSPADGRAGPANRRDRFLNGSRHPILLPTVLAELARSDGARVFHPYHGLFPLSPGWAARSPAWAAIASARAGRKAVSARTAKLLR